MIFDIVHIIRNGWWDELKEALDETKLDEAAIVFLADKLIQETQRVTIEKRFADSMSKCKSPEARKAHEQQLEQARKLQDMIQSLCHITL